MQYLIQHLNQIQVEQKDYKRVIPPLELWQPQLCGTMDLVIKENGEWWHEGKIIQRQALIDLFAKVLCYEDGQYYLKTPIEKIQIQVEDAPLQIKDVSKYDDELYFTTSQGDEILLSVKNPLEMRQIGDEWRPYIYVRYGLWASIPRAVFYHLIELGELQQNEQNDTILRLESGAFIVELTTPVT